LIVRSMRAINGTGSALALGNKNGIFNLKKPRFLKQVAFNSGARAEY